MKVLIAVDKFKGTLTGAQLTEALAARYGLSKNWLFCIIGYALTDIVII